MSNPVLSPDRWSESERFAGSAMTVRGAVVKTMLLTGLLIVAAGFSWEQIATTGTLFGMSPMVGMSIAAIIALVAVLGAMFIPAAGMPLALIYSVAKGVAVGAITLMYHTKFKGLPLDAAALTIATLLGMLTLYLTGIIKATPTFIRIVVVATVGLMLGVGLLALAGLFGIGQGVAAALYGGGPLSIGFSLLCIGLAAFNLVVDFHVIEDGARTGQPKSREWLAAMGLLVTLVWLYLELLRLLSYLKRE